jgi:hypothetical protein
MEGRYGKIDIKGGKHCGMYRERILVEKTKMFAVLENRTLL